VQVQHWMQSDEDLDDAVIALFVQGGLDGAELQELLSRGKPAFKEKFPDVPKDKTSLLFMSVQSKFEESRLDESFQIDHELSAALADAAELLGQRGLVDAGPNGKFEQEFLEFGELEEAALGVAYYLCVDESALHSLLCKGFDSIIEEVGNFGTDEVLTPPGFRCAP